jgi:hypothetical protein
MRIHLLHNLMLLVTLCLFLPLPSPAAPPPEVWLQTADALRAEAGLLNGARLRKAVQERAADLYRQYAAAQTGPAGAQALLQAGQLYLELGGDDMLARALECAMLLENRPDASSLVPDALMLKVRLFRQQKEWGRAVRSALTCAEQHPKADCAPLALFEAAQIFETAIRNPSEAEIHYGRILSTSCLK